MAELSDHFDLAGREVIDPDGLLIGRLDRVYLDRETDRPRWARLAPGALGGSPMLVPLVGATLEGDRVRVGWPQKGVWDAPPPASDAKPTDADEAELLRYYHLESDGTAAGVDSAEVIRSEEELEVGVRRRPYERVRLVKRVVTEEVTRTFTLSREELVVEREEGLAPEPGTAPATGAPAAASLEGNGVPHEMVLMEEQLVIEKRIVPRERVTVRKKTVTEQRHVVEPVRREVVEIEREPSPR